MAGFSQAVQQLRRMKSDENVEGKAALSQADFDHLINTMNKEMKDCDKHIQTLRNLDLIVFDNSIRESTVGQLRGHTLQNKWKIYDEISKCGFQYKIVAAFSHMTRVDDTFIRELIASEEDVTNLFAFTEPFNNPHDMDGVPLGLRRMFSLGLINPIIEIDVNQNRDAIQTPTCWCSLLMRRITWIKENLDQNAKILINFRDFTEAMLKNEEFVLKIAYFLSALPPHQRPFGLMFEEPTGNIMPTKLGVWVKTLRAVMDKAGWKDAPLLAHVHEKWGLGDIAQLECLMNGANGIWASVCEEGAALGHACSTVTIINLLRLGNTKVNARYDLEKFRDAAIYVTKVTTGGLPHPKKPIYGERALDIAFGFGGIGGGTYRKSMLDFDLADFFGQEAPIRISTLSDPQMIVNRLKTFFGDNPMFDLEIANAMKKTMIEDLTENRKEEYMSEVGLAMLFDRSGGKITKEMAQIIADVEVHDKFADLLINDLRKMWDEWNLHEDDGDDALQFDSFYNGFMAPYFGCFSCDDTRKGLKAIDMDKSGQVDWREFMVYVKWALREYPDEIKNVDDLLAVTFRKGLIPAMQDEILGRSVSCRRVTVYRSRRKARRPPKEGKQRSNSGNHLAIPGGIPQYRGMDSIDEEDNKYHRMVYKTNNSEYLSVPPQLPPKPRRKMT